MNCAGIGPDGRVVRFPALGEISGDLAAGGGWIGTRAVANAMRGQDGRGPKTALEDLSVLALSGDETVERTLTNSMGEVQLEPNPAWNLRISVGVPEIGPVNVPLPTAGTNGRGKAEHDGARKSGRRMKARQP